MFVPRLLINKEKINRLYKVLITLRVVLEGVTQNEITTTIKA